jgi:hypothetical protein
MAIDMGCIYLLSGATRGRKISLLTKTLFCRPGSSELVIVLHLITVHDVVLLDKEEKSDCRSAASNLQ